MRDEGEEIRETIRREQILVRARYVMVIVKKAIDDEAKLFPRDAVYQEIEKLIKEITEEFL